MVNAYIIGGNHTPNDENTINNVIPQILRDDYHINDEINLITGDLIDDTTLLFDRLSKDETAWLIILTDDKIRICEQSQRDNILKVLKDNPDKSVFDLIPPKK